MSGIRHYNAWIKAARKAHGLSLPEARAAYRAARDHIGRPLKGVDVKAHPRITGAAVKTARVALRLMTLEQWRAEMRRIGYSEPSDEDARDDVFDVEDEDHADDFDEYESSADYGEEGS